MIRLQKALAEAGVASRRASEKIIEAGRVKVNGEVVNTQGIKVDVNVDVIEVDGKVITFNQKLKYYMLNKPLRVITSAKDEKNRETVLDLIDTDVRVYPIGRLDFLSCGMLLLTNDGDLTYKLTHPKHVVNKKYITIVSPKVTEEAVNKLRKGGDIGPYSISPCKIKYLKEDHKSQFYEVTIHEGKNRQIRNMFDFIGSKVQFLKRIEIGKLKLGNLGQGEYRELTKEEVDYLKSLS